MIKDVLVVGFGAVGTIYAQKTGAKILVDEERKKRYESCDRLVNGVVQKFEFVSKYMADLIILSVKYNGLNDALDLIEPCIREDTIILSLLNGISSEKIIRERFPMARVVDSYLICDSMMKVGNEIIHDGKNLIVMDKCVELGEFFDSCGVNYRVSDDIRRDMWGKFMLNVSVNQFSAVTRRTFGEINKLACADRLLRNILDEVKQIAECEGVNDADALVEQALDAIHGFADYGKTSMLQDVDNNRPTEVEAFAGVVIELGKKYNIKTPYNDLFYWLLNGVGSE